MSSAQEVRPLVAKARSLSAIYLPGLCVTPPNLASDQLRVLVAEEGVPVVTILPARTPQPIEDIAAADRLILALEPAVLGRGRTATETLTASDTRLYRMAHTIRCGFRLGCSPPETYLESLVPEIVRHLRAHYPAASSHGGLSEPRLDRALAYIEAHLAGPIAVEDIAQATHLSPFHFARMFRRSAGISPHAYITRRRIERAQELLSGTRMRLAEIARVVGYRTQAHFTQVFHEAVGLTPLRYRRQQRG